MKQKKETYSQAMNRLETIVRQVDANELEIDELVKKKETYSQAMARLETIVRQVDNNELEVDELVDKIKEANAIIAFCSEKLKKADMEVEKLLADKQENEE